MGVVEIADAIKLPAAQGYTSLERQWPIRRQLLTGYVIGNDIRLVSTRLSLLLHAQQFLFRNVLDGQVLRVMKN